MKFIYTKWRDSLYPFFKISIGATSEWISTTWFQLLLSKIWVCMKPETDSTGTRLLYNTCLSLSFQFQIFFFLYLNMLKTITSYIGTGGNKPVKSENNKDLFEQVVISPPVSMQHFSYHHLSHLSPALHIHKQHGQISYSSHLKIHTQELVYWLHTKHSSYIWG